MKLIAVPASSLVWQCVEQTWWKLKVSQTHPHFEAGSKKKRIWLSPKSAATLCGYYSKHSGLFSLFIYFFIKWFIVSNTNVNRGQILFWHTDHYSHSLLSFTVSVFFFSCLCENFPKSCDGHDYWQSGIKVVLFGVVQDLSLSLYHRKVSSRCIHSQRPAGVTVEMVSDCFDTSI